MVLSEEQQLEMYSDIKVIKNNCVKCMNCQEDHEKRIRGLERFRWWQIGGCGVIMWIVEHFLH